jgi:predicted RNA-binding Zn ribbon-like protein
MPTVIPTPPSDYVFELDGGRACLDFANTVDSSGEHLNTYADLAAFAAQSDLITREDADRLRAEGQRDPLVAEGVLVRAKRLRTSIYAIFSALAAGNPAPERDLELLNIDLAASLSHARVVASDDTDGYRWSWSGGSLDAPIWPISRSAADLLTSDQDRRLVRECGADDCRWVFLDTSKNRSRQWCSMQSCGNREKARRHYQRLRNQRVGAASGVGLDPSAHGGAQRKQAKSWQG